MKQLQQSKPPTYHLTVLFNQATGDLLLTSYALNLVINHVLLRSIPIHVWGL